MELKEHKDAIEKALNEAITDFAVTVRSVNFSDPDWGSSGNLHIFCDLHRKQ